MSSKILKQLIPAFLILLIIGLMAVVSAYGWGGYYSPQSLMENEWFIFGGVFVLFFAIVFIALGRTFGENRGPAVAISLVVSLFITVAIERQGLLYSYVGEEIGGYLLIFALIIALILLLKVMSALLGGLGMFLVAFLTWYILNKNYYTSTLYSVIPYSFQPVYDFICSDNFVYWIAGVLVLVLVLAYSSKGSMNKDIKDWFWHKKPKSWKDVLEGRA
jgi:hypothetical protein